MSNEQVIKDLQVVVSEMRATSNTSVAIYGKILQGILDTSETAGSFQGAVHQILNIKEQQ